MLSQLINTGDERAELQAALRWDYSQLGDAAATVIEHTIEIKRNERRANDAVVAAGRHLIAVKETLAHGQWGDWLDTEFNMSDRTARTLMSIAERFDGKTEMISDLSVTVLGLLAAPSTPDAAVDAVIAANQQQPVRVADVKAIIADHKPAPIITIEDAELFEIAERTYSLLGLTDDGNKIARPFEYAGRLWIDVGGTYSPAGDGRDCICVHEPGEAITPGENNPAYRSGIFTGREVNHRGKSYIIGAQWLIVTRRRAAAAPSTISNQQSPINNSPSPAPRPSPLAPSPYKSLAQMDADGDIPPLAPRPSQPDTYSPVHPIQNTLRPLTAIYTAADLRSTANYRGGSRWFEARRLLAAAELHYRDRDLVQALNNLADELEQRDRTLTAKTEAEQSPRPAITTAQAADLLRPTIDDFYANDDARRYRINDMRAGAQSTTGGFWRACERTLANYTYTSALLANAIRLLADELEQSEPAQPSIPSTTAPEPDDRINRARILINHYQELRTACEDILQREREYEALVGTPSDLLAAHRGMHAIVDTLPEPIAKLQHLVETLITTRCESR